MTTKMAIYKVGGAVRDRLLGQPVKDIDWVVVGATKEDMLALGYHAVGADFPVFLHPDTQEEYALARTERKSGKGYGGFSFDTSSSVTLEQDLARRDLTINAIAEDEHGNLYDPYHGRQDIKDKRLKHVSEAFVEDPLRVLRVARFAARFASLGFTIAPETLVLMTRLSATDELANLNAERIWKEFSRALVEANPEQFLDVLQQCNALPILLPELVDLPLIKKLLKQATLEQQPLGIRWACLMVPSALLGDTKSIQLINQRFKVPNEYADLALLTGQYLVICQQSINQPPEILLSFLQKIDILRRPQRLMMLLELCSLLATVSSGSVNKEQYFPCLFLTKITEEIRSLKPQSFVEKGYHGAALGEVLMKERLAIIEQVKNSFI